MINLTMDQLQSLKKQKKNILKNGVPKFLFKIYTHSTNFYFEKVRNCSSEDKSSSTSGHTASPKPSSSANSDFSHSVT